MKRMEITSIENVEQHFVATNTSPKIPKSDSVDKSKNDKILLESCEKSSLKAGFWIVLYIFTILMSGILWSMPATIVPITNSIQYPGYWWEPIVTGSFFFNALYESAYTVTECKLIKA